MQNPKPQPHADPGPDPGSKASEPSREFYLNSDFDVGLRGGGSLLESADATYVHEMGWHFLFAGGAEDSLILHRPLPEDFLAYLEGKMLALPRLVAHPAFTPEAVFTPFGWDRHAEALAERYAAVPDHPGPESVRLANSRAFSARLERELVGESGEDEEGRCGRLCDSLEGLETCLQEGGAPPEGWVVKGNHGHAGTANRRIPPGPWSAETRLAMVRLLEEHGKVAVEPWHERLLDLSVNFTLEKGGGMRDFRGHQLLNSRDGAFLGVKILPSRLPPEPWREAISASASALAAALDAIGYFGPVGMDAYVRNSPQGPRLRTLVDINARHSMALPAHGLARRLPGKTLLWMWSKPKKLDLPAGYAALDQRLGIHAFDPQARTGILAVSPVNAPSHRPKRIGFLFSAEDEGHLIRLQSAFAAALGRA